MLPPTINRRNGAWTADSRGGRLFAASVNSSRPLRPRVIVHDSRIPKDEAPILDLESVPELGIRRSLKPSQLPRDALDYLSPRKRICYFFERAVNSDAPDSEAQES